MYFAVSEEEFQTLAESLRPWTQQAMKIEVAPWIKDYVVDMDDLYTELKLEKSTISQAGIIVNALRIMKNCL